MAAHVDELIRYYESLAGNRQQFENQWQELSDSCFGRHDFVHHGQSPGRQRQVMIYDSTSLDSNTLLAAALHALITNPATNWFDVRYQMDELNELDEAIEYLEIVKQRMRAAFSRPGGGFTTNIGENWFDIGGWGNACMFIEEDAVNGPIFMARPLHEIYIDVNHENKITSIFRDYKPKAWQAVSQFGAAVIPKIAEKAEKDPGAEVHILHHVRQNQAPLPGKMDASGMAWESIYINLDDKKIISEGGGFREMPYLFGRWRVDSGEMYGRGPGNGALVEQKMLNSMWRTLIRNAEKRADPPVLVSDGGVMPGSKVRTTPSAQIVVRDDGGSGDPVRYLEHKGDLGFQLDVMENRQKRVEKTFHSEIIQAFQDPRMTATQVLELARLSQRILSPVMGRLQTDMLDPMMERVFSILSRRSDWPEPPDFLVGQDIKIEYVSPVARAQKQSESQAILDSFTAASAFAQADPSVLQNIDLDESVRLIFKGNGVPMQTLRSRDAVKQMRAEEAEAMEQQREQELLMRGGETIAKLLPGIAKINEIPGGAAP